MFGSKASHSAKVDAKKNQLEFKKLLALVRFSDSSRWQYTAMFVFLAFQMATYQLLAYSLKYLINTLYPQKSIRLFLLFTLCWIAFFAIHGLFTVLAARFRIIIVRSLVAGIRSEIIRKLQILSMRYFDTWGSGSMSARLLMDVDKMQFFFDWLVTSFFTAVMGLLFVVPLLTTIDPLLTAITVLYIPTIPLFQRVFRDKLLKNSHLLRNTNARLSEKLIDFISGIRHIRMFATEDEQSERILAEVANVKDVDIQYTMTMRIFMMVIQFFSDFMPIVLWVVAGVVMMYSDRLTMGGLVAYVALIHQMLGSTQALFSSFDQVVAASPSVKAISEIIDSSEIENQRPHNAAFTIDGAIGVNKVDFSYETRPEQLQLADITVSIAPGEKVALVGESGSGKTTFVNAIMGLYPIKAGAITFGNHQITEISLKRLRSQIAIMSQDAFLFNTSLMDNVRFANLKATDDEVHEACRKAEILDFIESLPEKFNTCAGERGVQLSGGQRQRIGLARVFLRNPKIIILDEPSSSLDVVTERKLFETLYNNVTGKTLIIIAHRMSTIKHVDTVFVFDKGAIVERGKPVELQARGGMFRKMIEANMFEG